ncbi:DNA cytosine methyltransferase [Stenotrophomonas lacuserhaii]|nr:DNA cytosine methyltransferase [Stenotrophomonas pennii]
MRYVSLFSGMEAAHLAWEALGWTCVGVAEIEPVACAVLAYHLPHIPNLGSVTEITDGQVAALGPFDVLIGGSPCQDLSVAGRRAGLAGARSSLFHHQMRIFNAARHFCGTRWLIWENVPGAFSSNEGRDFAVVVGAMAGCDLPVPSNGWGSEGIALGDNGLVEWSVLDAQWFGVRRLTPRECERLQGVPDDWTLTPNAKGKPMADGPRYKLLGNSFAVPVVRWIGTKIAAAHRMSEAT